MTIRTTSGLLALTAGYIFISSAWAQGGAISAPELKAEPIPGLLDIDFRCDDITKELPGSLVDKDVYEFCRLYERRDIISVSTTSGTLTHNKGCPDNPSDPSEEIPPLDGYGIDTSRNDRTCDDGIGKGESLVVRIDSKVANQTAAFDVNGVWLTDFRRDKNGESGVITLTLAGDTTRSFTFNWKDVSSENITLPNPNDEFFVGFGETLRMTKAVISGNSGAFSVAGFSQQPVVINTTRACAPGSKTCNPEIARNVRLELKQASGGPGNKGVEGTLFKEGVYVIPDTRPQCQPGASAGAGNAPLPIHITGNSTPDLIMLPHQCGHPAADSPNLGPVIYVLDLDGSRLNIAEDTITAIFDDDSNNPNVANTYFCTANDPAFRPGIGWLPKSQKTAANGFLEIPVFDAAGNVVRELQDNTVGPCGSSRGSVPRYSYVVYNWVNRVDAAGTSYDAVISARIEQLAAFVDDLFACVQQGVNQSTFSSDVGRIRQSFSGGRYERALQYVVAMKEDVLDPRLNSEIGEDSGCSFDLEAGTYLKTSATGHPLVPSNAVGNLLVQLDHLDWMIRTTVLGQAPATVPPQGH